MECGIIYLNVGGIEYTTSASTLCKYESFLSTMVRSKLDSSKVSGSIFIDRNGELFVEILEFLRSDIPPYTFLTSISNATLLDKLQRLEIEADFYQIIPLIENITSRIVTLTTTKKKQYPLIKFNVGDHKYTCSYNLLVAKLGGSSRLMNIVNKPEVMDGEYIYIDRDGKLFGYIIEYVRCGIDKYGNFDLALLQKIRTETEYYGLDTLTCNIDQLQSCYRSASKLIKLNVGGKKFMLSTILFREYLNRNAFLDNILNKEYYKYNNFIVDEEGYIFVDRNAKLFKRIINYLRMGNTKNKDVDALVNEIEFYFGHSNNLINLLKNESHTDRKS